MKNLALRLQRRSRSKKVFNRKVKDDAYIDFILKCSKWQGEVQNNEKDKCDEIRWADKNDIPTNIIPFVKEIFKDDGFIYHMVGRNKNVKINTSFYYIRYG